MSNTLTQLTKKLADFLGESSEHGVPLNSPSLNKVNEYFKEHSIASLFPYESYDPSTQLYHNRGNIGFVLECKPLCGADPNALNVIDTLFKEKLPERSTFHALLYANPEVDSLLDNWKQFRTQRQDEIYATLSDYRMKFMQEGCKNRVFSTEKTVFRDFQLTIDVAFPPDMEEKTIVECKRECIDALSSLQMGVEVMDCERFLKRFYPLINPTLSSTANIPEFNPHDSLAIQLAESGQSLQVKKSGVFFDEGSKVSKTFRVTDYPAHWDQWKMGDLIGDAFKHTLQIGCPFLLSFMAYVPSSAKENARAHAKSLRTEQQANTALVRFLPKLRAINDDWKYTMSKLAEGDRFIKTSFQITLQGTKDTITEHEASLSSLLNQKKWKFSANKYVQLPSWLLNLPMMMNQEAFDELVKFNFFRTLLSSNIKNILPFQGEAKGQGSPLLMLTGRRGQLQFVDFFDNPSGNYNVAVAAKSGAGKSVFIQEYVLGMAGSGAHVSIIDVGRSYQKLVEMLEGQFIEFSDNKPISLNPFSHIEDLRKGEHLQLLKPLVAQMASPNSPLESLEMSFIEEAIIDSWDKHHQQTTVTHIANWLKAHKNLRAVSIGEQLYSYTEQGMYGNYFSGPCTLDFNNPIVCLELEELKSKKDLQGVVLLLLMYQVSQSMYLGDRSTRRSCIIDEVWDLFKSVTHAASFIEEFSRRARKYNANIVTISQSLNDYYANAAAKAALDNADWVVQLASKQESIDQLIREKRLNMDPYTEKALRSLNTLKGQYSEILIRCSNFSMLGRLALEPFSSKMYFTSGEDFAVIKRLRKQGASLAIAIKTLIQRDQGRHP